MRLQYQLTVNDYLEFEQTKHNYDLGLWRWAMPLVIIGYLWSGIRNIWQGMAQTADLIATSSPEDLIFAGFLNIIFGIVFFSYYYPKMNLLRRWTISRTWQRNSLMRESINVTVTNNELTLKAESYQNSRKWQSYTRFREAKQMFLLYDSNTLLDALPKRAFSSQEQIDEFRLLLQTNIKQP